MRDIAKLRELFEAFEKLWNPGVEFLGVNVFETVLELRAADAVFHS